MRVPLIFLLAAILLHHPFNDAAQSQPSTIASYRDTFACCSVRADTAHRHPPVELKSWMPR
jgi:hypothetical protein